VEPQRDHCMLWYQVKNSSSTIRNRPNRLATKSEEETENNVRKHFIYLQDKTELDNKATEELREFM